MILLIDNYDSFVHNLARYLRELGHKTMIIRNDKTTIESLRKLTFTHIILSPGPCTPNEAGICLELVKTFNKTPILGVCLGHQIIGQAFGGTISRAIRPLHGKQNVISHNNQDIFYQLPNPLAVAQYHSLIVNQNQFPHTELKITALSEENEIMAIQHKKHPIYGVQFHPESVLTEKGHMLLENFIKNNAQT